MQIMAAHYWENTPQSFSKYICSDLFYENSFVWNGKINFITLNIEQNVIDIGFLTDITTT